MRTSCTLLLLMALLTGFPAGVFPAPTQIAQAQDPSAEDAGRAKDVQPDRGLMQAHYIPDDALAVVVVSPGQWLESPLLELFPTATFRVQMIEQFGIDLWALREIRAVILLDPVMGTPQVGVVIRSDSDVDFPKLLSALNAYEEPTQVGDYEAHLIDGPEETVLSLIDDQTVFVGLSTCLPAIVEAGPKGTGPLPTFVNQLQRSPGVTAALTLEPIRPMLTAAAGQLSPELAPPLQPVTRLPELTETILARANWEGDRGKFELTLVGGNERDAQRIERILGETLVAARDLLVAELQRSMATSNQSPAMREAVQQDANRIADRVIERLSPDRDQNQVALRVESPAVALASGLAAIDLLPMMRGLDFSVGRMNVSNNMKQVMLGMHNYHSAYKRLPPSAITDDEGKPLLSWRVAILPFVEEQALYEQFHLDEPWDSEHNLPLSKKLPAVYRVGGVRLPPGHTCIQAVVGKEMGMKPLERTAFRDFLDGLSNSLLIVQTNTDSAVPWSKPDDVAIDLEKPLEHFIQEGKPGFHVGLGDGAVIFLTKSIDPGLFKALLTRAGRETIDQRF
ncbi:DUF1559 domain-containing protein [Roseiconus nitratireducens]|uniref:DUF1559 domain-containing protein n=1 Tax=Roseiconus nitratireducens TaxID=2605748 RepID=A0A5M6D1A0_9BACT|nr:DUF1559 domain-containing protein [Roseiconus nitratireducens]KAA5540420.1 DUF1559 domain-containing protein [Roseiconus nitratireducens]